MLIDSHCHLIHPKYNKNISQIYEECLLEGVTKLINIGTHILDNIKAIEEISNIENIYTSIGIYPHEDKDDDIDYLINKLKDILNKSNKIIGIGECGIDIGSWENGRSLDKQIELFEKQINLAIENNLPIIIHNRNGDEIIPDILKKYSNKNIKGVVHGTPNNRELKSCIKYLDLGFYLSFGGNITYPSNNNLREILKNIPNDKILLETDSPYLPPQNHRGELNHPKYVRIVAEKVSLVKEIPFEDICNITYNNTCLLFNI